MTYDPQIDDSGPTCADCDAEIGSDHVVVYRRVRGFETRQQLCLICAEALDERGAPSDDDGDAAYDQWKEDACA